jgi:hypothetical protein
MDNRIYTLVYLSTSSNLNNEAQLENILKKSRHNNSLLNITGMLLYAQGIFVQVLEGDKSNVEYIYNKIMRDRRNFGAIRILDTYVEKRSFKTWAMGFKAIPKEGLSQHLLNNNAISDEKLIEYIKTGGSKVLLLLQSFYQVNFEDNVVVRF